jgi:hypothetical protein
MKKDDGYLSGLLARITVICQLHEAYWMLTVSDMSQDDGHLSFT